MQQHWTDGDDRRDVVDLRLSEWAIFVIVAICLAFLGLVAVSAPDLDNLPAYECNPGSSHTTKECS